jgi:hypothetical protein
MVRSSPSACYISENYTRDFELMSQLQPTLEAVETFPVHEAQQELRAVS